MKDTTLYIVRHGQTEWNVLRKMQGHQDSPLTDAGILQAQWLGEYLREEHIDYVYSSSSARARRTAEIIRGDQAHRIVECDEFKEINLGVWEGKTHNDITASHPVEYDHFWNDPEKFRMPGSETFQDVLQRAMGKIQDILTMHSGKSILIVTHTVVVKLLMAHFEGRPLKKNWDPPYIHPASLCKVVVGDDYTDIKLHGYTGHFKEKPSED